MDWLLLQYCSTNRFAILTNEQYSYIQAFTSASQLQLSAKSQYPRMYTLWVSRDKRYSELSEIQAFATLESISVLTIHFHLPVM